MFMHKMFMRRVAIGGLIMTHIKSSHCSYDASTMYNAKGQTMSGSEFKTKFPHYVPVKLVGNNHNDFNYTVGHNVDTEPFIPGKFGGNGLYFTDINDLPGFIADSVKWGLYGSSVALLRLDDHEPIYLDWHKCKTHAFNVTSMLTLAEFMDTLTPDQRLMYAMKEPSLLKYIEDPQIQRKVISKCPSAIQHINEASEELTTLAFNLDPSTIQYIKCTAERELQAVSKNGSLIQFCANKHNEEFQLVAVAKYGKAIQYIVNPSEKVQIAAINRDPFAILYINNPNENVQMAAIDRDPFTIYLIDNPSRKVQLAAIRR